jgi:hypothetical protein
MARADNSAMGKARLVARREIRQTDEECGRDFDPDWELAGLQLEEVGLF